MRTQLAGWFAAFTLASCGQAAAPAAALPSFDPNDPTVVAAIDSMVALMREGANEVDADATLSPLNPEGDLTFMTGDVLLAGKEQILKAFRHTYSQIRRQRFAPVARQIRLIAPDVALFVGTGRGTFQDSTGYISDPVGLGNTGVFVRRDGVWRLVHYHQSVAP